MAVARESNGRLLGVNSNYLLSVTISPLRKEIIIKRVLNVCLGVCAAVLLSYGANWNAKLLDANCAGAASGAQKTSSEKTAKACAPTSSTMAFAIESHGRTYTFDKDGNEMIAAAMKNGTIKADEDGDVHVNVNGTAEGDTIKIVSVSGSRGHESR